MTQREKEIEVRILDRPKDVLADLAFPLPLIGGFKRLARRR